MTRLGKVDEKEQFREALLARWTEGLSPIDQRISIFSHIRDIPYGLVSEWKDTDDLVRMMITANLGWCGPKHHLLAWMFDRLGITIRFTLIPFRWEDQKVRYPVVLKELVPLLAPSTHLCCTASLNGVWQLLDATWDPPLGKAGFPVNDPWDGISGTVPAVISIEQAAKNRKFLPASSVKNPRIEFVVQLNRWLEEVRKEPG